MPVLIDAAREEYELADHLLPYPLTYKSYDPLSVTLYPSVGSYVTQSRRWTRVDINEMGENVYEARYAIRVFVWCRTPETPDGNWVEPTYDSCMEMRDWMMAILRSTLLNTPSLRSEGTIRLEEDTLTEDFLDAMKANDQSSRWMAGGIVNIEATVQESTYLPRLATANTVVVEASKIQEETP
jgi:hypothetical protein